MVHPVYVYIWDDLLVDTAVEELLTSWYSS